LISVQDSPFVNHEWGIFYALDITPGIGSLAGTHRRAGQGSEPLPPLQLTIITK